jgi:hypothetical protein
MHLAFMSEAIFVSLNFIVPKETNIGNHNIDTIQWNNLYLHQENLTIYQENLLLGEKVFNNLPYEIKNATDNLKKV